MFRILRPTHTFSSAGLNMVDWIYYFRPRWLLVVDYFPLFIAFSSQFSLFFIYNANLRSSDFVLECCGRSVWDHNHYNGLGRL